MGIGDCFAREDCNVIEKIIMKPAIGSILPFRAELSKAKNNRTILFIVTK
ncbi:MAG: hypothetical protein JWR76_1453 [Mucilaginibacter sp.]|jgi:hypothetical protein|nr:hypothetical protein [Mucilaginibacter sp.]